MNKKWKLPLYKIYSDDEDLQRITNVIKRGSQWAIGPEIEEFENALKEYVGTEYCVTVNSGTSALHASLLAYGFGKGDEILVPSFSFISTANCVLFTDSLPNFCDIEYETFGLDPMLLSQKITKKTKAIIPMDYGGQSCEIDEIMEVGKNNDLIIIEDAAESLGSQVNGKKVGSMADLSIFSFCGNKVLTTGEGGAMVTNSREIYEKLKLIRSHGRIDSTSYFDNPEKSDYVGVGYNWRLSSITAALGLSQIAKLDKLIQMRQENAKYISNRISKISTISVPNPAKNHTHIYQMYSILINDKKTRDALHNFLIKKEIFSKIYFNPIHLTKFYQEKFRIERNSLPVTEDVSDRILTLPMYPNMLNEEKDYLINTIFEFFEGHHDS